MGISNIQWTDYTFNHVIGCSKVHTGCLNCYAEADMDKRRGRVAWGVNGTRSKTSADYWKQPLKWNKEAEAAGVRRRVFCSSLADVFEDWKGPIVNHENQQLYVSDQEPGRYPAVPFAGIESLTQCERDNIASGAYRPATMADLRGDLFRLIDKTPWLDWQLLTKRPGNIQAMWWGDTATGFRPCHRPNVWLGTSISDQTTADKAIPELLKCRNLTPVLFLSVEPLLGPIEFSNVSGRSDALQQLGKRALTGIDWVIIGGESGSNARPCRPEWIRSIVKQCKAAGVPCFVKQMGGNVVTRNDMVEDAFNSLNTGWPDPQVEYDIHGYREDFQGADCRIVLHDKKGGDPAEWPDDLRVREFPLSRQ